MGGDRESTWEAGVKDTQKVFQRKRIGAYFVVAVTMVAMVSWGGKVRRRGEGVMAHVAWSGLPGARVSFFP